MNTLNHLEYVVGSTQRNELRAVSCSFLVKMKVVNLEQANAAQLFVLMNACWTSVELGLFMCFMLDVCVKC